MNNAFGKRMGQYVLLEQLGEGGMAKVYNALDSRVESNVAIKVILPNKRTSSVFLQQFEREAKALANLTHTNIVKVLNYGVQSGQPYLVMEYVPGGTLKDAMTQKIPWQTAAAILAPIARALEYVHQQQIVHRDVKPSNILLHEDFRPMLSDFGILKILEGKDENVESAIGAGVGTPEYMPPEQGMGKDVDFRADIYSLGLVFYEMVTGQKPYTADSPMAMVIKHVTDPIPLPSRIDRNIPRFVERAILRAVQKDPRKRYMSMGHFADVLELIALGDKASRQKINRVSREQEKRQRSISIATLSILFVILTLGTAFFIYNYFYKGTAQPAGPTVVTASPSVLSPTRTPQPTATALAEIATLPAAQAPVAPSGLNTLSDLTLLGTPIVTSDSTQFKEIARWGIGGVNVVRWSPDGNTIALGTTSGLFLYDTQTKEPTLFIDTEFNVLAMAFNPVADEIAAGSPGGVVRSWNYRSGELVQSFTYSRPASETITKNTAVAAIAYAPDGQNLAVGYENGAIDYFPSNQSAATFALDNYPSVKDLAVSANNQYIYASNGSRDILVWDIQYQEKTLLSNPTPINRLRLSSGDQQFLLAGGGTTSVYLWDLFESKHVTSFTNMGGRVTDFDFSDDHQTVAVGLATGEIKVFDTPGSADYSKTHVPVRTIAGHQHPILSLSFSSKETIFATGNLEEGLKLWNAQNGENVFSLDQSMYGINEIYLSRDGLWMASGHADGLVRVWNVTEASEAYPAQAGYLPKGAPFSPDSNLLAFIYSPGNNKGDVIRVFDLQTGDVVAELPGYIAKSFVQFSDDSRLLVMGDPYKASIWDVSTWEQLDTGGGPTAGCGQYFTPQNHLLAMISNAGIMFTSEFDRKMQEMCGTKPKGAALMYYFYGPHQMVFVLGDAGGTLWTWDFGGSELARIGSDTPYALPSEIFLAGDQASGWYAFVQNGTIVVRNIDGSNGTTINNQNDYRYRVALQPEQKLMALGSTYGSIHIWSMP